MLFKVNSEKYDRIVIALCGVFQCVVLIDMLASTGQCDEKLFEKALQTIFKINTPTVLSVFEDLSYIAEGAKELLHFLKHKQINNKPHLKIMRYVFATLASEVQLQKHPQKMTELRKRIEQMQLQVSYFSLLHDQVIANLADLYLSLVSVFRFRIQIIGNPAHLKNPKVLEKIRALFLAALRAGVLWQQVGGRRWQLFFAKRAYLQAMERVFL